MNSLLIIDGFNLLSRAYFATAYGKDEAQLSKNDAGQYVNALRVFWQKTANLVHEFNIGHLVVAWDIKREESKRRLEYSDYKMTRNDLPEPLIEQYETCCAILTKLGIAQLTIPPYEADDIIGTLTAEWARQSTAQGYMYSNDKDLLQLIEHNVSQLIAAKQGEEVVSLSSFRAQFGIEPSQWIDVKALLGDKSDNIPGCPGIGEKSALPLVQMYGSIENIYEAVAELDASFNRYKKKLIAGEETARLSKRLSTIDRDIAELLNFNFNTIAIATPNDWVDILLQFGLKIKVR